MDTRKYVYVLAYKPDGETLCFAHEFVYATDEEEAYHLEMEALDDTITDIHGPCLCNNYVIKL